VCCGFQRECGSNPLVDMALVTRPAALVLQQSHDYCREGSHGGKTEGPTHTDSARGVSGSARAAQTKGLAPEAAGRSECAEAKAEWRGRSRAERQEDRAWCATAGLRHAQTE
jgi:hypothetical protein